MIQYSQYNTELDHTLKLQIIKVVRKYSVSIDRTAYMKQRDYSQEIYVEKACEDLNINYIGMCNWEKEELCEYCHRAVLSEYRRLKTLPESTIKSMRFAIGLL